MRRTWARSGRRARPSRSPRCLPARSSRSKRSQRFSLQQQVEDYVRTLGLDAYVDGGAVRDELLGLESKDADFLVLGVDHEQLRAKLEPHGRVEDLEVAGQRVGLRLRPRDPKIRKLVRSDNEFVDPFDGQEDLNNRVLRTVSPRSFAEDPLRIVRGLRFVSQLDLAPDDQTLRQMIDEATSVRLVSGERIGGGLQADGMGELSRLLLGPRVTKALRLARDTGVLVALIPEFGPVIGYDSQDERQGGSVDEHTFAVVANAPVSLPVRLAALLDRK